MNHFRRNGCAIAERKYILQWSRWLHPSSMGILIRVWRYYEMQMCHMRPGPHACTQFSHPLCGQASFPNKASKADVDWESSAVLYCSQHANLIFSLSSGQSHGRSGKNYSTAVLRIGWAIDWCSERESHKLSVVKIRAMKGCVLLSQCVMNFWACIHMSCYKLMKCVRTVTVL